MGAAVDGYEAVHPSARASAPWTASRPGPRISHPATSEVTSVAPNQARPRLLEADSSGTSGFASPPAQRTNPTAAKAVSNAQAGVASLSILGPMTRSWCQ